MQKCNVLLSNIICSILNSFQSFSEKYSSICLSFGFSITSLSNNNLKKSNLDHVAQYGAHAAAKS